MSNTETRSEKTTSTQAPVSTTPTSSAPTEWTIDPVHSEVGFKVRHMMVSWTRGSFGKFEGRVHYDERKPESLSVDVTIDAASIDTKAADRDTHLRSADFLDVEGHPHLTFKSKSAKATGEGSFELQGELTIRGVTRPVTLEVTDMGPTNKDPWGNLVRGAQAKARISRKDFGLNWNSALETGGVLVGDEVQILIEAELRAVV